MVRGVRTGPILATIAAFFATPAPAQAEPPILYSHSATVTLPGGEPDWDYFRFDQPSGRLFVARHDDGLSIVDVKTNALTGTVPNSKGANGPLTLPEYHRGYVAMTDGTILTFDLDTLKEIGRVRVDPDGLNGAIYDPASRHVIIGTGRREKTSRWYLLDAATGKLVGKHDFDSAKMDDAAPDGKGLVFAPMRDRNVVLKMRSSDLAELARFALDGCNEPSAVEYIEDVDRLVVACRGAAPILLALDPADGRIVASLPIGAGVDGIAIDYARHRIVTSNGGSATLSVIGYDGPDRFALLGTVATQPGARTMQMDRATGQIFLVTADYTQAPPGPDGVEPEPYFHPGSFRVLTYTPE